MAAGREATGPPGHQDEWFTLRWRDGAVEMLDQRKLPRQELYVTLRSVEEVAQAIETMVVRGAPAIGCAAALGVALAATTSPARDVAALHRDVETAIERLGKTRPTAVNLFWGLRRMREELGHAERAAGASVASVRDHLLAKANAIVAEDVENCRAIGRAGLEVIPANARLLTHCNAGALATAGYGTALGVVRAAHEAGRLANVLADETRPFLQGARLTAWELHKDRIPVTVIADVMAGHLMKQGEIDVIVVGADRIAANGDTANKIGTYSVAVLAKRHGIPFYVAAPLSTVDLDTPDGDAIPIEERGRAEVAKVGETEILPDGVPVRHPAFDVTPHDLIAGIITEIGVARPSYTGSLRMQMEAAQRAR
jgi:methylthioribose-1-phosphate isomerase